MTNPFWSIAYAEWACQRSIETTVRHRDGGGCYSAPWGLQPPHGDAGHVAGPHHNGFSASAPPSTSHARLPPRPTSRASYTVPATASPSFLPLVFFLLIGCGLQVAVDGYKSSALFVAIKNALAGPAKSDAIKKVNGVFHLVVKNAAGKENTWTIDLKEKGDVLLGAEGKADITISLSDDTFVDLADGKINGQKAFMAGKLKVKGNIGLATKLDTVLKAAKTAAPAPAPAAPAAASAPASDTVNVPGFESGALFAEIEDGLKTSPKAQLEAAVKKVKAVFQFDVKNAAGTVQTWTLDLKNGTGSIVKGTGAKADVTIAVGGQLKAYKDFVDLANGKLNGQKAFMSGKIKVKGQIMLATKLDSVLKDMRPKAKL
ncbi:hypothetical protein HDU83_007697 [Entophlyctis luteolus]|nr:hypothetical protein HDU83_007697 [Entophlyctis luteolus]